MGLLIKTKMSTSVSDLLCSIAKGEEIMVWCGRHNETPKTWVSGPATLIIKVGRKKRMIRGKLREGYEGHGDDGETYSFYFTANSKRVFSLSQRIDQRMKDPRNIGDWLLERQL